jgi:type IV secretion system protein VirB6
MGFFMTVGESIDEIFEVLEKFSTNDMMGDLASLLSLSLSIMIIVKAYAFLAGKSNELIKDIVYDGIMKLIKKKKRLLKV